MSIKENKPAINIKKIRLRAGLSQNALAKKADVSQSFISEIESGVKRVSLGIVLKLAKALDCTIEDLLPGEGEELEDTELLEGE